MRSVGTARRIDQLGRVVIPAELRKILGIRQGDLLDIRVEDGRLTVLKIEPRVRDLRQPRRAPAAARKADLPRLRAAAHARRR